MEHENEQRGQFVEILSSKDPEEHEQLGMFERSPRQVKQDVKLVQVKHLKAQG